MLSFVESMDLIYKDDGVFASEGFGLKGFSDDLLDQRLNTLYNEVVGRKKGLFSNKYSRLAEEATTVLAAAAVASYPTLLGLAACAG